MIISKDTNPEKDLYYIGGLILKYFNTKSLKKVSCNCLFQDIKAAYGLSTNIILLSLDWLYILDSIKLNEDGEIEACF